LSGWLTGWSDRLRSSGLELLGQRTPILAGHPTDHSTQRLGDRVARRQDDRDSLFALFLDDYGVFSDDQPDAAFFGAAKQVERTIEDAIPLVIAAVIARSGIDDHSFDAGCDCEVIDIG
jgi:hypothetical protein